MLVLNLVSVPSVRVPVLRPLVNAHPAAAVRSTVTAMIANDYPPAREDDYVDRFCRGTSTAALTALLLLPVLLSLLLPPLPLLAVCSPTRSPHRNPPCTCTPTARPLHTHRTPTARPPRPLIVARLTPAARPPHAYYTQHAHHPSHVCNARHSLATRSRRASAFTHIHAIHPRTHGCTHTALPAKVQTSSWQRRTSFQRSRNS